MPNRKDGKPRANNWPKSTKVSIRVPDTLLVNKPVNMTPTEWIINALSKLYNA